VGSLPLIALWKDTRRNLWLALGTGHAVTVGVFGLITANFMPPVLRLTHGVEIICDSFAYAGLLVLLFAARQSAPAAMEAAEPETQLSQS
jgi:hypothetical protein